MLNNKKVSYILLVAGNSVFFIGVLIVNGLANIIPIGGNTTGELSDSFPTFFTPAGITFSIWGVIYLLFLLSIIYQTVTLFSKSNGENIFIRKINVFFMLSCIFNILWIFSWHHEKILLSLIVMVFLFTTLLIIYLRLREDGNIEKAKGRDKFFLIVPFSIYLGWITVASIANISIVLVKYNWNGFGISPQIWTIILIAAASIIGLAVLLREKDISYNIVLIWAFTGIIIKRAAVDPVQQGIITAAGVSIFLLVAFIFFTIVKAAGKTDA